MLILDLAQLVTACFPVLFTTHGFRLELGRDQDLAVLELSTLNAFPQSDEGKKLREASDFVALIFTYSHLEYLSRLAWDVQVEPDHLVIHFGGPSGVLQTDWQLEKVLKFSSTPGVLEEERGKARVQLLKQLEARGIILPVKFLAPK